MLEFQALKRKFNIYVPQLNGGQKLSESSH